ncbi:hypothetical protein TrVE_jg333 [Triparma verrucosa]|nr:hypothetical protein TrVE_jg333 [Triparma verrucosa]
MSSMSGLRIGVQSSSRLFSSTKKEEKKEQLSAQQSSSIPNGIDYKSLSLQEKARSHSSRTGRPWGVLHCSVISNNKISAVPSDSSARDSPTEVETYSDKMSFSNSYMLAPPPSRSSYGSDTVTIEEEEDEEYKEDTNWFDSFSPSRTPITPIYSSADCVCVTIPREGTTPDGKGGLEMRFRGMKWLSYQGSSLDDSVERVLVMDATDLNILPLSNSDPNAFGSDVESLWSSGSTGSGKPTRILLRRGVNQVAVAAAKGAADAAKLAMEAAERALEAAESGDAEIAADAAAKAQGVAEEAAKATKKEMDKISEIRNRLEEMGTTVETLSGGRPRDVMQYLGDKNSYELVVWRAGCWGERGVESIEAGAFQSISAHIAVDGKGGKFWQTIVAEQCVQGACGARSKIEVKSDGDISLEYCDDNEEDEGCIVTREGHHVRHVRLDCDIRLADDVRFKAATRMNTKKMAKKFEGADKVEGPWFM